MKQKDNSQNRRKYLQMKQLKRDDSSKYASSSVSKSKQPNQKVYGISNRHFSKDIQMTKKHTKRCSMSLIIREREDYNKMSPHIRMVIIKKSTNKECWRGCGEKGILVQC